MYAYILGYYTRTALICLDCIAEYGKDAGIDDEEPMAVWSDDDYLALETSCDYCGTLFVDMRAE
jgi:hypothetical protein